ncbi:MAG: TlyA family RNA methyltransferase [Dehalococcoidia bacterium]|nr:MAG: TlyA family RNA methyltransferase [Dehalococcoidia bacterium]
MLIVVPRKRIDSLLVTRGIAESREKARAMVMSGDVFVDDVVVVKPGTLVKEDAHLRLQEGPKFVSRGGIKLERALDEFNVDVTSLVVLDVGASTGGFTDCLLKRGASRVYAVDVGYGQLDYRLRQDSRVIVMERVNARYPLDLPESVDLATLDLSFISLEKVIPSVADAVKGGGRLIALVKPQFETERRQVKKGGLVKAPQIHADVLGRFISWAVNKGFRLGGIVPSPILGADGNKEFFVYLNKPK